MESFSVRKDVSVVVLPLLLTLISAPVRTAGILRAVPRRASACRAGRTSGGCNRRRACRPGAAAAHLDHEVGILGGAKRPVDVGGERPDRHLRDLQPVERLNDSLD